MAGMKYARFVSYLLLLVHVACGSSSPPENPLEMANAGHCHIQSDFTAALPSAACPPEQNADEIRTTRATVDGITRTGLYMQAPGVVRFPVFIHHGATFLTWITLAPTAWTGSLDGALFRVVLYAVDPPETVLLVERHVDPHNNPEHQVWLKLAQDLSFWGNSRVVIELSADPGPAGDNSMDWCIWGQPMVYSPPLPAGNFPYEKMKQRLAAGEWRLDHDFVATRAVSSAPGHEESSPPLLTTSFTLSDRTKEGLYAHPPWSVTRTLIPGVDAKLFTSLGIIENCWDSSDGVLFCIEAELAGSPPQTLLEYSLCPRVNLCDRGWVDVTVDLSLYANRSIKLTLSTGPGSRNDFNCDSGAWAHPLIISTP